MNFIQTPNHGWLEVITGCMFSGKTAELIRRIERVTIARGPDSVIVFKPIIDTRYTQDAVVTHYGREFPALLLGNNGQETLPNIITLAGGEEAFEKVSVIAFDEGNFFSQLFIGLCEQLVDLGKRVIVSGLDLTFAGDPFGPMPELMAIADEVTKLHAVCVRCGGVATRTQRLINGEPAGPDSPLIIVGDNRETQEEGYTVKYEARCRQCHE